MPTSCLVLFSGGLDSTIAVHLLRQQNLAVTALHFVLPFDVRPGREYAKITAAAEKLGVPLRVEEQGEDFLALMKNPKFGFGKNANPCMDCRIRRLVRAREIMQETGASFIATGEVVGQRPMSQRRDCLDIVEKQSGLKGLLLRPLSAQLLRPTVPEEKGWVDRSLLLGIGGRGRTQQLDYARTHGLSYATPAGGCLLTQIAAGVRFGDLKAHTPDFDLGDLALLGLGRHFRINPSFKLIVGRNDSENRRMERQVRNEDRVLSMDGMQGPVGIGRGNAQEDDLLCAARILSRFSKARTLAATRVSVRHGNDLRVIEVPPADDALCDKHRIGGRED